MKVLVTGGAGFIGSHVVEKLARIGHTVTIVDNMSSGKMDNIAHLLAPKKMVQFAVCDIRNLYDLVAVFLRHEPDVVMHLAAQPSIVASQESPFIDLSINAMGTLNVIHAAERSKARRIVFASTSAVYPTNARICQEMLIAPPESPYGISKQTAENYLRLFGQSTILRLGNVYGPRQVPLGENQVIPRMIRHRLFGDEFSIHGDGKQVRDYIYVEDVAQAFVNAMMEIRFTTYNIGTGKVASVNHVANQLDVIMGVYGWPHDDMTDPRWAVVLDVEKAKNELGWKAETSFEDGLKKTVAWWKKAGKET